ncbi:hypothetical protein CWB97_19155 [Pseudoalteromonas citrea]|uniref:Uncharacterized protein n=1 Tax=Pseudoalteromonas citrea TaxID=43655 RepID=A0ABY2W594_9GAMM|nr:hypothetical protein CWB97_19155 [Pseudoalteromonas citrea]
MILILFLYGIQHVYAEILLLSYKEVGQVNLFAFILQACKFMWFLALMRGGNLLLRWKLIIERAER